MSELGDKERRFVEDQRKIGGLFHVGGNFMGHVPSACEHRTVGPHRAWCYDCREWCYPDALCVGCGGLSQDALLAEAAEVLREFTASEPIWDDDFGDRHCNYCYGEKSLDGEVDFHHEVTCPWLRAKPLLDKLGERE